MALRYSKHLALAVAATAVLTTAMSAQTVDTRPVGWAVGHGGNGEVYYGDGLWGQSFTAPGGSPQLTGFSFWIGPVPEPALGTSAGYDYRALLYAFDGTAPTGSALYTSDTRSTGEDGDAVEQAFSTGALPLSPGSQYIALVQLVNGDNGLSLGFIGSDSYAGGMFYEAEENVGDPTATTYFPGWNDGDDLAFTADFSQATVTTPEPGSLALVGTGLIGLVPAFRRRRR